jgi:hypothetical protein
VLAAGLTAFGLSSPALALFDRGGDLGVGARAMGLSGAFVAVADDYSAAYWNPAGLGQLEVPVLGGMYGSYFNDKDRNLFLSFEYPLSNGIHLAVSTNNLFYTDVSGSREDQYMGSVAIPLDFVPGRRLFLGANFRFLLAELGGGNGEAEGCGVDLGILFKQPFQDKSEVSAGLALTDLSTSLHFDQTGVEQAIPSVLTAGLAYRFDPATLLALDVPWTLSNDLLLGGDNVRVRAGVEHWFFDGKFGLRAGYVSFLTIPGEFSIGGSYRTTNWSLDYAFMNHSDNLGNSHRLDVSYLFNNGEGTPEPKPYMVQSLVGDQKIYLKWDIPEGSKADGFLVYIRADGEKNFHRAKQELLQTKYCLLRGAVNGLPYHVFIRSVVGGQERYECNEWVVTARPMSEDARKYFDQGLAYFKQNNLSAALYSAQKAEEFDPNNYDIKDLIQKLKTTDHEGLVPEEGQAEVAPEPSAPAAATSAFPAPAASPAAPSPAAVPPSPPAP